MFILVILVNVSDFNSSILQFLNYLFFNSSARRLRRFALQRILQFLNYLFFNSSILITNTLSLGLTLSGTLMLMRWPLVACSTGFRS